MEIIANLGTEALVFMAMVFVAIVLLAASVIVPTLGTDAQASRRMRRRIGNVLDAIDPGTSTLLREQYLKNLSPTEQLMENLPGMEGFGNTVRQAGIETPAYRIVFWSIISAIIAYFVVNFLLGQMFVAIALAVVVLMVPYVNVLRKRASRMAKFEEQLPEALDMMSRALQAGHPFNETVKMIAEEMDEPIAGEFNQVFSDINYGLPMKTAFVSLLNRVPSVSLNAVVTAVLIQSESGGRLAEILQKIAAVIRGRFKLMRKVRSLSAEGRLSAWILALLPFVMVIIISITTPSYLPKMLKDPVGINLIFVAFAFMIAGILWMRKILRFKY